MICMSNSCKQGRGKCPTPLTCSGFDPAAEAPINFARPPREPEPATWAWVDDLREQGHDLLLALMGVAAAGVVGALFGIVVYLGTQAVQR